VDALSWLSASQRQIVVAIDSVTDPDEERRTDWARYGRLGTSSRPLWTSRFTTVPRSACSGTCIRIGADATGLGARASQIH
jgi:hypothetical protein